MASLTNRFYDRVRHPSARSLAHEAGAASGFGHLRGHRYCLLVSYKRSGEAVPTPVWFGLRERELYVRTEAELAKVKRIRNDPRVLVAPCTARGRPLGPSTEGRARVLEKASEEQLAEAALEANHGLGRRLYKRAAKLRGGGSVYLEVTPA